MSSHNKKTILITGLLALVFGLGSIILTPSSQTNQQANIFQSIRNFFSFNRERPQPQPEHLFEEESIKAFQEQLFDPTVIHLKLTQDAAQVYRQTNTLPQNLQTLTRQYRRVSHQSTVNPIKNPTHPVSYWVTFNFATFEDAQSFSTASHDIPEVTAQELDWKQETQIVPNDEFYQPGSSESLWGHNMINIQAVWDIVANPGEGILVGVLDTGISNTGDVNHPLTHADLVGSEWINPNEILNNGIDDDGNGYIDDYLGGFAPGTFPPYEDRRGHGTHVAGTIGARGNNSIGLPGIAFSSTLLPFKFSNTSSWSPQTSVQGIVYATDQGVDVINNSWGGLYNSMIEDAVLYAHEADVVVISAAGNNSGQDVCNFSPVGSEYSFAVSAVSNNGMISNFSNVGNRIDVAAPGGVALPWLISNQQILSTRTRYPNPGISAPPITDSQGNEYISINGTSMATPHVSGVAAILRQQYPTWNNEQVYSALRLLTDNSGEYFADGFGHGILDASNLTNLPSNMPVANLYEPRNCTSYTQATLPSQMIPLRFSAYVPGTPTPDSVRIEVAEGTQVSDQDFTLIATLQTETIDDIGYMLDTSDWNSGAYTIRILTEYNGLVVEDRNQISYMGGWELVPFSPGGQTSISMDGNYFVTHTLRLFDTNIVEPYQMNSISLLSGASASIDTKISGNGQFVVFSSSASNLVPGDTNTNGVRDIFVHDRETGVTERVSVSSQGEQGNGESYKPSISADGRYVAFNSIATNLVPGDTNGVRDVFVHDRETGITERVSVSSDGQQGDGHSELSIESSISADGRFVAFKSSASNLVPGDTNGARDVFVHDRETGITERVSVSSQGEQSSNTSNDVTISSDGRFVVFNTNASNLLPGIDVYGGAQIVVHDRETGMTEPVSVSNNGYYANGPSHRPTISEDGRFVVFTSLASNLVPGDINENWDVFVRDREAGLTELVSVDKIGGMGLSYSDLASISANGQYIIFRSYSYNFPPYNTYAQRAFLVKLWDIPTICPGDFNGDEIVNTSDLAVMLGQYGLTSDDPNFNPLADFDNNGIINVLDLSLFFTYFGQLCEDISIPDLSGETEGLYTLTFNPLQTISGQAYNMLVTIDSSQLPPADFIDLRNMIPQNLELKNGLTNIPNTRVSRLSELRLTPNTRLPESITLYLHLALPQTECEKLENPMLVEYGLCG